MGFIQEFTFLTSSRFSQTPSPDGTCTGPWTLQRGAKEECSKSLWVCVCVCDVYGVLSSKIGGQGPRICCGSVQWTGARQDVTSWRKLIQPFRSSFINQHDSLRLHCTTSKTQGLDLRSDLLLKTSRPVEQIWESSKTQNSWMILKSKNAVFYRFNCRLWADEDKYLLVIWTRV